MREAAGFVTAAPEFGYDYRGRRQRRDKIVMGAIPRRRRERWRRTKSRRKLERPAKDSERKTIEHDESVHGEQSDRLLASALKYWEVERDLIEERLAAIRRATAAWNFTPRGR